MANTVELLVTLSRCGIWQLASILQHDVSSQDHGGFSVVGGMPREHYLRLLRRRGRVEHAVCLCNLRTASLESTEREIVALQHPTKLRFFDAPFDRNRKQMGANYQADTPFLKL